MAPQRDIQDYKIAFAVGTLIAILALPTLENLGVPTPFFLWLIFLPFATVLGLFVVWRLFKNTLPVLYQIGKYGIIGILNTVLSASIFNLLISSSNMTQGIAINLFALAAFFVSVTNSFLWNKFWTFSQKERAYIKTQYIKFFLVNGVVTILDLLFIHTGVNIIGAPAGFDQKIWANIIFFLTIPVSFLGNFLGYRRFVFRNPQETPKA